MPGTPRQQELAAYQASLPVRLMATARSSFVTCSLDERIADVGARNAESFDYIPVTDGNGAIAGVLYAIEPAQQTGATVRECMQVLHESLLIGAEASILDFVRLADQRPFRFVVDGHHIEGLVCLSDLQQLPVRAALFAMVTQLEISMAAVIEALFDGDAWRATLSHRRQQLLDQAIRRARTDDNQVDALLYTQFCDKADIIRKAYVASGRGGLANGQVRGDFDDIQALRNHLAHGNDFAHSREAARSVCALARTIDDWFERLHVLLATANRSAATTR